MGTTNSTVTLPPNSMPIANPNGVSDAVFQGPRSVHNFAKDHARIQQIEQIDDRFVLADPSDQHAANCWNARHSDGRANNTSDANLAQATRGNGSLENEAAERLRMSRTSSPV